MRRSRLAAVVVFCTAQLCAAYVPDAKENCRLRNAALCDFNGSPTMVQGDCPPHAKVIKPRGTEDCEHLTPPPPPPPPPPPQQQPQPPPPTEDELRRLQEARSEALRRRTEARAAQSPTATPVAAPAATGERGVSSSRALIPVLLLGALGLIAFFVARSGGGRATSSAPRTPVGGTARNIVALLISGAVALPVSLRVGAFVFGRVFDSFDNHDTAAPVLLAAPVALVAIVVSGGVVFTLLAAGLHLVLKRR